MSEVAGIDSHLLSDNGKVSLALRAGRMFTTRDSQKLSERVAISGSDTPTALEGLFLICHVTYQPVIFL